MSTFITIKNIRYWKCSQHVELIYELLIGGKTHCMLNKITLAVFCNDHQWRKFNNNEIN